MSAAYYTIDGNNLRTTYGIYVIQCSGDLDLLKRKGETSHSWPDQDGVESYTDARDMKFEPRTITLNCVMVGKTKADFLAKHSDFKKLLEKSGLRSLYRSLTYKTHSVYFADGCSITPPVKWVENGQNVAYFTLKLIEPVPAREP